MDSKIFQTRFQLVFALIYCGVFISSVEGKPVVTVVDGYVDTVNREYLGPYQQPITDYHLSRLRRGYYYVEDGFITAIPESIVYGKRRVDTVTTNSGGASLSETQLTKYKRTNGKRKKLFVPNLFG